MSQDEAGRQSETMHQANRQGSSSTGTKSPPHDEQVRFQTRVLVPPGAAPDYWQVLRDALNKVLPAGRSRP